MDSSLLLFDGRALAAAEQLVAAGMDRRRASFELSFDTFPRHVGFAVTAGVEQALDWWGRVELDPSSIRAAQEAHILSDALANRLGGLELRMDFDAVPEGTVVFPNTPVATLEGSLLDAVLMRPVLASCIERASTAATATARLVIAADGDAILEATSSSEPSADGALSIARAGFVGGAMATTNAAAAMALRIPFRSPRLDELEQIVVRAQAAADAWASLPEERLLPLDSEDEEAALVEAKRMRHSCDGWLATRLTTSPRSLRTHFDLVALEEDGAWKAHTPSGRPLVGGRKILVRYTDRDGRPVADVVHLHNERMMPERRFNATALAPLARARVRAGRPLASSESATDGHQRLSMARHTFAADVTSLRSPATFRVEHSEGVRAVASG